MCLGLLSGKSPLASLWFQAKAWTSLDLYYILSASGLGGQMILSGLCKSLETTCWHGYIVPCLNNLYLLLLKYNKIK